MSDCYILDADGTPVPEPDLLRWAQWFEQADRSVEQTELADGALFVSTVFLGLDHAFGGGPPLLWETMVFHTPPTGPATHPLHHHMERYSSLELARAGHALIVAAVLESFRTAAPDPLEEAWKL